MSIITTCIIFSNLMSPSRNFQISLKLAVSAILIFSFIFLPSQSGSRAMGLMPSSYSSDQSLQQMKMVLGSRPPGCVNKCMSCQPCKATLVIPPHQNKGYGKPASHKEDDSYYLLSWKCRCGNKLFQP